MSLSQIASTTQGSMVGDYMSTSVVNGKSVAVFAVDKAPTSGQVFDEALYTAGALSLTGGTVTSQQATTAQNAAASRTQIPLTTLR
ncbi:hypothetical protein [Streptomyces sp. NPDC059928]|uniref:hypothetical protein n=1 Tax=unclassified Streptomyces TaxID=2593676 RepID=UPI003653B5E8